MLFLLFACAPETEPAPAVTWLAPAADATVGLTAVAGSVVVDDFVLMDAAKHEGGGAEGYLAILVDGAEVLATKETTFTLDLAAGVHELTAQLFYTDGDEILATATEVCEEDATDAACLPAMDVISVTAE